MGNRLRRDHMHVDIPRSKRCRHLETDEARADHHGPLRRQSLGDQERGCRPACADNGRAEDLRRAHRAAPARRPWRAAAHRRHTGCRPRAAPVACVDRGDARAELQVDVVLLVELCGPKRIGFLGRCAREIALRKIGAVTGHRFIGAQHGEAAGIALPAEHFRSGVARRAATHDDDRSACRRLANAAAAATCQLFPHIGPASRCSTRQQEPGSAPARAAPRRYAG